MPSAHPVHYAGHDTPAGTLADIATVARLIADNARPGPRESCSLADALGRVIAAPVTAPRDLPAFDKSMMDGFAVRSADCAAPVELRLVGEIPAGSTAPRPLSSGEAMRINTGAPLPQDADAVAIIERAELLPGDRVRLLDVVRPGHHVIRAGSVCCAGQTILDAGTRLGPAQIGAIATTGISEVVVFTKPRLALAPTGNEVIPAGQPLGPGQIHESNGPTLVALGHALGADILDLGICRDDRAALTAALQRGLECPILVVVGGMSMGTLDLVPGVLAELGVRWLIHGVDIRPGRPMGYGISPAGQHVFGLPGNPSSCFVCFNLFVRIAIDGLSGLPAKLPQTFAARLTREMKSSRDPRPAYLPAKLTIDANGVMEVEPVAWQGSGDAVGLGRANALVHQPSGGAAISIGEQVHVMPIGALSL